MKTQLIFVLTLVCLALFSTYDVAAQEPPGFPTLGWPTVIPEEQGVDSEKLAQGLRTIRANDTNIHSLMLVRNGSVVVDAYFYPYDGSTVHDVASVTKSILTTLIGIAIDQGKLSLDDPVLSFFPDRQIANRDQWKEQMTVRHLASMSSGLDCTEQMDEATLNEMRLTPDWVQFALDRKMVAEPGTQFEYCSPGMHLLSAILQRATGMTALDFATQYLFDPLGIHEVRWLVDPQGYNFGWSHLFLYPSDLAKIGLLWLNLGMWDGQQLVSRDWVEQSVTVQMKTQESAGDYGYGWWVARGAATSYSAQGRGGQSITVVPALHTITVTTGDGFTLDQVLPLLRSALVDPEQPLPANPTGITDLQAAHAAIVAPSERPLVTLPETARQISGKTIVLEPNPGNLATLTLEFNDTAEAVLSITQIEGDPLPPMPIGLDNVYRIVPGEFGLPQGARGHWADEQTFVVEYDRIANNAHYLYTLRIDGDRVGLRVTQFAHELGLTIEGALQNP